LYAILALPFFDSKNHLKQQQREVFADLLMIFALIFLIALVSGNYILNLLIGPLKLVSDHIKRTTLEDHNQPIDYTSADEIGVLVREYNQMLIKLERNKEALARSQKESAWKEIARQVAHEIKNPLTPMRLKIQQLQRDMGDERKYAVLQSLITQIDTLSHIADSFSEFAKMPAPINTQFDIRQVISQSVQLHRGKDVRITTHLTEQSVIVWADPNIMDRILNNLILNAVQAVKDSPALIHIAMHLDDDKVIVSIQDNGEGIPEDIQDKIFTTYFSTKSTGSGIGLAVAKKGIENAGGHIWFETSEGEGTTFFISLPVYAQA
jgi:nitrogen fixation/metabolism regulation signal transduction histidine kinase